MKKKQFKIILLILSILLFIPITIFANTLKVTLKTNKKHPRIGEKIKIIVDWNQGMQAADFSILYDSEKIEFVKSTIDDIYINNEGNELKTAWFSMDDKDKSKIEYVFKTKTSGVTELTTKINGGFATGELEIPNDYENGSVTIEITNQPVMVKWLIGSVMVVGVIVILTMIVKRKKHQYFK